MQQESEEESEHSLTMVDILKEERELEEDAAAVLGAGDDASCTYNKDYMKRQALYACLTCCPPSNSVDAGICLACSYHCHEGHDLVELYTKRKFCCDCGNGKFPNNPCNLTTDRASTNVYNKYNQNFKGVYCICSRPYPDPDNEDNEDIMIQCCFCEDWFHGLHLGWKKPIPTTESYEEMVCSSCFGQNNFLKNYLHLAINEKINETHSLVDSVQKVIDVVSMNSDSLHLKSLSECCCVFTADKSLPEEATFFKEKWRKSLCSCLACKDTYIQHDVLWLLDEEDTVSFYEEQGKLRASNVQDIQESSSEMAALSKLDRVVRNEMVYENLNNLTVTSLHPQEISSVTVSELRQLKFSQLSLHDKVTVRKRGRSTPDIQLSQPGISNNKRYIRSFNSEWYQRKSWLCGCEVKNALFCFPCLLFGGDVTWTKNGFRNINKMKEKTEKHEKSKKHVENMVSLSLLGNINIKEKLSEAYRLATNEHNMKVKKNREILSKIIDCILYCGNFETPLCGHDEKNDLLNPGVVFMGLINFASKLDLDLKNHLETSTVFKGVSKTIQNEILDCLLQIYHEEIRTEIRQASSVAIMADDTTDVSEHTQMVIVLRYMLNEQIFEHFWGFFIPANQTADGISKCILKQLEIIFQGNGQKLIAQTFDGANIMKGKKAEVKAKIKAVYSNAHFIHCYTHELNLIMRNAASITRNARIFFSNILAIPTFFSRSPQHISIFKKHMDVSIPCPSSTRWNFNIWTVNRVYENLQPLKSCLTEIQSTSNADQTIAEATGILKCLNDDNFMFWLELFHQIMPHVEVIYNQMQSQEISAFQVNEYVTNFKTAILEIRNSKYSENPSKTLTAEAKEVCDCICVDIMDRYSSTKHLVAAKLFNKKSFPSYKNELPTKEIVLTTEAYPMIDKEKLETELRVFYCRSDMHEYCKIIELLKFILESNLDGVLSEITKLIKVLLTIPMTTSEPERCFSTLKRIKYFLRSSTNPERLSALAVLSIEKNFLNSHPGIKEKIINLFAQSKRRRMDFIFK